MSENVYSKVLSQLVAKEGSAEAVASLLHVPEKTLQRWLGGRAAMPVRAFLRALSLVVQHEERGGAPPVAAPAAEPLVFRAGAVVAACPKCGGEAFRLAEPRAPHTYGSLLACCACAAQIVHHQLIAQLAEDVARRAGSYVRRTRNSNRATRRA